MKKNIYVFKYNIYSRIFLYFKKYIVFFFWIIKLYSVDVFFIFRDFSVLFSSIGL